MTTKTRTRLLVASGMALIFLPLSATPAHARNAVETDRIEVRHYSPDDGYDNDLLVKCGASGHLIFEGRSSRDLEDVFLRPDCKGVTAIYVRPNEEWWSKVTSSGPWYKRFDATGWHLLPHTWSDGLGVTVRRD